MLGLCFLQAAYDCIVGKNFVLVVVHSVRYEYHFGIHVFDLALEIFVQVDVCLVLQDIAKFSAENVGYVEVAVILGLGSWKSVFAEVFQCLFALGEHEVGVGLAELFGATFKDVYVFFIDVHDFILRAVP